MTEKCRICKICGEGEPRVQFGKNKNNPDGKQFYCLDCYREKRKAYEKTDHAKQLARARKRKWKQSVNGKKSGKKSYKKRYSGSYRIAKTISGSMYRALKGNKQGLHWEDLVPYNLNELKLHLECLFLPGMNWKNYGKWHIDHHVPISFWKIEEAGDEQFQQCFALTNLKPMWAADNIRKGNKIEAKTLVELVNLRDGKGRKPVLKPSEEKKKRGKVTLNPQPVKR